MNSSPRPINNYESYHAHVYFNDSTESLAQQIYTSIDKEFNFDLGRIHLKPVGPHTQWMFQVAFTANDFETFINWLESNRQDLSILIHPLSGDNYQDHSEHAQWLGQKLELDLKIFEH
ncbi:hypothetical protein LNTAR_18765 [Lentisphaera araneosa HTCC2155]|jgi:aromatic ring-cleaving dioxygenase|uniref:4,5-dioxygenase n=2 Tax=Lentisphaera TaxID=256846 RepID=A6DNQ9_9BACT|nr:hypothetical protein LNTAR_18765 [Lentisphaera araneosa HTCC2155]